MVVTGLASCGPEGELSSRLLSHLGDQIQSQVPDSLGLAYSLCLDAIPHWVTASGLTSCWQADMSVIKEGKTDWWPPPFLETHTHCQEGTGAR